MPSIPVVIKRLTTLAADFPAVISHSAGYRDFVSTETGKSLLQAAKREGDFDAALTFVKRFINPRSIEEMQALAKSDDTLIVPIIGREGRNSAANQLPLAFARELQERTGWVINDEIIRLDASGRRGLSKYERLIAQPSFGGTVYPNRPYVIVDDMTGTGTTLRNAVDFIESQGGQVAATSSLIANNRIALKPDATILRELNRLTGGEFARFHDEFFGITGKAGEHITPASNRFTDFEATLIRRHPKGIADLRAFINRRFSERSHNGGRAEAVGRRSTGDATPARSPNHESGRSRGPGESTLSPLQTLASDPPPADETWQNYVDSNRNNVKRGRG